MNFKIVICVLAVLAVQMTAGRQIHQTKDTVDDIVKGFGALLANVTQRAANNLKRLDQSIANVEDNLDSTKSKAFTKIVNAVISLDDALLNSLDDLKDTADETGKKLIECVEGITDKTHELTNSTVTQLLTCSTDDATDLLADVRQLVQDMATTVSKMVVIATNLENCTDEAMVCARQCADDLYANGSDFHVKAYKDLKAIFGIIKGLNGKIQSCGETALEQVRQNRVELFSDVTQCLSA